MLAGKHLLQLRPIKLFFQGGIESPDFQQSSLILNLCTQFDQQPDFLHLSIEPIPAFNGLFPDSPLLENSLGIFVVIPKTRSSNPLLQLLNLFPFCIYVKETPVIC